MAKIYARYKLIMRNIVNFSFGKSLVIFSRKMLIEIETLYENFPSFSDDVLLKFTP